MKIPKTFKLPRTLKKEVKKGVSRNIQMWPPVMSSYPGVVSCSMFQSESYSGSNTKSFRRLCKYFSKEQRRAFENLSRRYIIVFEPAHGKDYSVTAEQIYKL